jgi:hypothetical protein
MPNYKVTYLLGAGASCNALPLLANFSEALEKCSEAISSFSQSEVDVDDIQRYQRLLNEVAQKGRKHRTIDSYAKWCLRNYPKGFKLILFNNTVSG